MSGKKEAYCIQLQAATDPDKSLERLLAMHHNKTLKSAVVIAEHRNGEFTMLGQMTDIPEIARLLWIAAQALPDGEREINAAGIRTRRSSAPDEPAAEPPAMAEAVATDAKPFITVAALWAQFDQEVLKHVSKAQTREMEKAFYAGCWSMFDLLMKESMSEDEAAGRAALQNLHKEMVRFFDRLSAKGEAGKPTTPP